MPRFRPMQSRAVTLPRRVAAAAIACGFALAMSTDALRAAHPETVEIVLHVPYPVSGPQEIQTSDRASRSYRAIAARAAPPITDTMAGMVEAALWTGADLKVSRTRRATTPCPCASRRAQRRREASRAGSDPRRRRHPAELVRPSPERGAPDDTDGRRTYRRHAVRARMHHRPMPRYRNQGAGRPPALFIAAAIDRFRRRTGRQQHCRP